MLIAHVIDAVLQLKDQFSAQLKSINGNLSKFQKQAKYTSQSINKISKETGKIGANLTRNVTTPLIGLGTLASKSAMSFKESVADIDTLLDDHSHLKGYEQQILNVSKSTGMNLKTVSEGMYTAVSSLGDGGKETQMIFKTMANSAKAGKAEVNDSVALISSAMKGYGSVSNETAKKISDLAFQTAKLGVTTFPEMAKSMQPLFPLAKSLNFSYEELFGSMATLTGVTGNTSEVSTQLKAVFSNMMKPTKEMSALIHKYGFSNAQAMIKSKGLTGVMEILQKETGGNADKMGKLFSSTEAITALTALTGQNFGDLVKKTNEMKKATGSADTALRKISSTTQDKFNTAINNLKVSLTELGIILLPVVTSISDGISKVITKFNGLSESQKKNIVKFAKWAAIIGPTILVISKLGKATSKTIRTINKFATSMKNVKKTLKTLSSPGSKFITIMYALALVAILIITHWDKVKKCFNTVSKAISKATGLSQKSVAKFLIGALTGLTSLLTFGTIFSKGFGGGFKLLGKVVKNSGKILKFVFKGIGKGALGLLKIGRLVGKGMISVISKVTAVMMANPIIAIIVGIIAICVLLYEAWKHNWGGIRDKTKAVIDFCKNKIDSIKETFNKVREKCHEFKEKICEYWGNIKTFLAHPIQGTISLIKNGDLSGVKGKNALGTSYWGGGLSVVGEHGPEIVDIPQGSKVHDNKDTTKMLGNNGNISIYFGDVHVREESDIDKIINAIIRKLKIAQLNRT